MWSILPPKVKSRGLKFNNTLMWEICAHSRTAFTFSQSTPL